MLIITPIIIGIIFGPIVTRNLGFKKDVRISTAISVVGAIVIRLFVGLLLLERKDVSDGGLSLVAIISSMIGAILFTYIYNLWHSRTEDDADEEV